MRSAKKWLNYTQIFAVIGLSVSYFLPISQSQGTGNINYPENPWMHFLWVIPAIFIISKITNRWWKSLVCLLSILAGVADLYLNMFLAYFKRDPLFGFHLTRASIILLVISWLALIVISLFAPRHKQAEI